MFKSFKEDEEIGKILYAIPRAKDRTRETKLVPDPEAKKGRPRRNRERKLPKSVPVGASPSFVKVWKQKFCAYSNANDPTGLVTVCWFNDNDAFEDVESWEDALKLSDRKAAFCRFRNATHKEGRYGIKYKVRETEFDVFWIEEGGKRFYNPEFTTLDQFVA